MCALRTNKTKVLRCVEKKKWLDTALDIIRSLPEDTGLTPKNKKFSCVFKSTFSPLSPDMKKEINNHWHIIQSDCDLSGLFTDPPLFVHSRPPNLRDELVCADTHIPTPGTLSDAHGNFPCKNCVACSHYLKCNSFTHPQTGKTYKIKQLITCKTTHVIYIMLCSCPLLYVGKTKRALRTRIVEHMSAIRRQDHTSPVFRHFESAKHSFSDFKFLGIERVLLHRRGGNRDRKLLQREAFWIFELKSLTPTGLNEEMDLACFL